MLKQRHTQSHFLERESETQRGWGSPARPHRQAWQSVDWVLPSIVLSFHASVLTSNFTISLWDTSMGYVGCHTFFNLFSKIEKPKGHLHNQQGRQLDDLQTRAASDPIFLCHCQCHVLQFEAGTLLGRGNPRPTCDFIFHCLTNNHWN